MNNIGDKRGVARREWLLVGVGAGAALAGGVVAWRRLQPQAQLPEAEQMLWRQQVTNLEGAAGEVAQWRGKPLLVNFWATWCPPCVRELPMLSEFSRNQGSSGLQVLGLAIDKPEAVRTFLTRQPLHFPIALVDQGGLGLTRSLGNSEGALPFSVLLDAGGHILQRKIGELSTTDLAHWGSQV